MSTFYCAAVAARTRRVRAADGTYEQHVDVHAAPFAVEADDYYQAVGKAQAVTRKVAATRPGWSGWRAVVSDHADDKGVVTDPENITIDDIE